MSELIRLAAPGDLPARYRDTAVEQLVRAHNFGEAPAPAASPPLVVGTCIDARIVLRIPPGFAYLLRTSAGSLRHAEYDVAFAVGAGGARAIAIVAHTDCLAGAPDPHRERFIAGLTESGWKPDEAESLWTAQSSARTTGDAATFAQAEAARLQERYPNLVVLPLVYDVADHTLCALRD